MASPRRSTWLITLLALSAILLPGTAENPNAAQQPLSSPLAPPSPHRIAIIGAGAAGSSAAYHLHQFSSSSSSNTSHPLSITLFESTALIGGRTRTIPALSNPLYPTELGASIFAAVNHILIDAAAEFNLTTISPDAHRPRAGKYELGIWDGREFVYRSNEGPTGWLDLARLFWRYGLAPLRTRWAVQRTVARFLSLYTAPLFPWQSLTEATAEVGLLEATASTGREFLRANGVGERFGREIIQASTRVNYGQNLGVIHGLETMVCMATEGARAVEGGNWRIFEGMVRRSGAEVRLNTSVEEIVRLDGGGYRLASVRAGETAFEAGGVAAVSHDTFDTVILAAPLQFSGLRIQPPLAHPPDEIPYVTLYATLFTSPHRLSPRFFATASDPDPDPASIPEMILTTLPDTDTDLTSSPHGVGPTHFWSISTLRAIPHHGNTTQYLYKIFSPAPLTGTFISRLLNFTHDHPPNTTPNSPPPDPNTTPPPPSDRLEDVAPESISWSHTEKWHSYPYEYPRVTFEEIQLDGGPGAGAGLWYTSGMESFISTMETSALMGRNVAGLVVGGLVRGEREGKRGGEGGAETGGGGGGGGETGETGEL